MTPADYAKARRQLMRRDPVLGAIIRTHGPCGLADDQRHDPFASLIEAIVWQQLSFKAAQTIYRRFRALFPEGRVPTPEELLAVSDAELRAAGLSRQKIASLRDLAAKVHDGTVPIHDLGHLDDEAVAVSLTKIRGIGRWSADMFLMFKLHRPDILPVGDLGIVKAIQRAYRLRKPPTPDRMRRIAEPWRPYRSIASWYLWASLEKKPV